jgi:hypothetical protein
VQRSAQEQSPRAVLGHHQRGSSQFLSPLSTRVEGDRGEVEEGRLRGHHDFALPGAALAGSLWGTWATPAHLGQLLLNLDDFLKVSPLSLDLSCVRRMFA